MKRYTVVEEDNLIEFEERVTKYLNRGWKCVGGVFAYVGLAYTTYAQAMEKNVESDV